MSNKITVTVKMKKFRLKAFTSIVMLVGLFHLPAAHKMIDWLKVNIDRYFTDDKLVNVNGLILEIAFTYLYYNNDSRFRLDKYVNKKYIEDTFKVTLDGVYINNVVNTIKIGV